MPKTATANSSAKTMTIGFLRTPLANSIDLHLKGITPISGASYESVRNFRLPKELKDECNAAAPDWNALLKLLNEGHKAGLVTLTEYYFEIVRGKKDPIRVGDFYRAAQGENSKTTGHYEDGREVVDKSPQATSFLNVEKPFPYTGFTDRDRKPYTIA